MYVDSAGFSFSLVKTPDEATNPVPPLDRPTALPLYMPIKGLSSFPTSPPCPCRALNSPPPLYSLCVAELMVDTQAIHGVQNACVEDARPRRRPAVLPDLADGHASPDTPSPRPHLRSRRRLPIDSQRGRGGGACTPLRQEHEAMEGLTWRGVCAGGLQLDRGRWASAELDRGWCTARRNSCHYGGWCMRAVAVGRSRGKAGVRASAGAWWWAASLTRCATASWRCWCFFFMLPSRKPL